MREPLHLWPTALDLAWADPKENLRRIGSAIKARLRHCAVPPEQTLFVLPELTLTGFVTKDPKPASPEPVCELARRLKTGIAVGYPETNPADPKKPFNTFSLVGTDGRIAASYRKMHLFTAGKNSEASSYSAGESGVLCDYRGWKTGFAVCFDIRFPALFRAYAKAGADLILVSACWIGGPHKSYQYKTVNSGHAILAQAYVAAVNRSGRDPFYEYDGAEYVFSPYGENVHVKGPVTLDPAELDAYRKLIVRPWDGDRKEYGVT
jgi:predicted amidohydrolase